MITICLVNETISDSDLKVHASAVSYFAPFVTKAWKLPAVKITTDTKPQVGAWNVFITERNRKPGARGFHTVEGGLPVAYCSPKAAYKPFGAYFAGLIVKGKRVTPERVREGLITVLCHEIAEMLCDPKIDTVSAVDSKGRAWLVEVCDHVFGQYLIYTEPVSSTVCVLPDVTTASFYDLKGKAPYSIKASALPGSPFTLTPQGYGYYKDATGKLIKIV